MTAFIIALLIACALIGLASAIQPRGIALANEAGEHATALTRSAEVAIGTIGLLLKAGTAANEVDIATAGDRPLFVALREAAIDDLVAVAPLCGAHTRTLVAGAAIAVGDELYCVGSGQVAAAADAASGDYRVGVALTAAAAQGDEVEVAFDAITVTKA